MTFYDTTFVFAAFTDMLFSIDIGTTSVLFEAV